MYMLEIMFLLFQFSSKAGMQFYCLIIYLCVHNSFVALSQLCPKHLPNISQLYRKLVQGSATIRLIVSLNRLV